MKKIQFKKIFKKPIGDKPFIMNSLLLKIGKKIGDL
jgi:hypothetical protein